MKIFINDKECTASKGQTLLQVALDNGFYIPTLCHNKDLGNYAGCRLCVAELRDGDWSKLVASCEFPVKDGQTFFLETPSVIKSRNLSASLLLARSPKAKEVLDEIMKQDVQMRFEPMTPHLEGCILCGKCYRACQKLGTGAISTINRGHEITVETPYTKGNADCIACLACAESCPTGAIKVFKSESQVGIWHQTHNLLACPICGKKHITQKALDFLSKKTGIPSEELIICPDCRQKKTSMELLSGISR